VHFLFTFEKINLKFAMKKSSIRIGARLQAKKKMGGGKIPYRA
jgi:hypothetical protein